MNPSLGSLTCTRRPEASARSSRGIWRSGARAILAKRSGHRASGVELASHIALRAFSASRHAGGFDPGGQEAFPCPISEFRAHLAAARRDAGYKAARRGVSRTRRLDLVSRRKPYPAWCFWKTSPVKTSLSDPFSGCKNYLFSWRSLGRQLTSTILPVGFYWRYYWRSVIQDDNPQAANWLSLFRESCLGRGSESA
jgi:hypothetical protein